MAKRTIRLAAITFKNLYTKGKRRLFNQRNLTTNKCGLFGDSLQALYDGAKRNGNHPNAIAIDLDLFKETGRIAALLAKIKGLPPIVVYLDRQWIHVRVSKREFDSWSIRNQNAFMNALSTTDVIKDDQKLTWSWVGIDSSSGYMALKAVYSGYGSGHNRRMELP